MNPCTAFNFKVKEVIGYTEHYDGEDDDNPTVISVDVYLSGGQTVTLDLKDDPVDSDSLADTLGFDGGYWDTLYSKDNNPTNLFKSNLKSEVKSTYNPYE